MNYKNHYLRILAIDLRTRRFGYAVFEGSKQLLDYGLCLYGSSGGPTAARKRMAELLKLFSPSMISIRAVRRKKAFGAVGVRPILAAIKREAAACEIPMQFLETTQVKKIFQRFRAHTKHEIASVVAQLFPELVWKLPPKRKVWQKEHYRMAMFEAIGVGYAYWQLTEVEISTDCDA